MTSNNNPLVFVDARILAPVLPSISLSLASSPGAVGLVMTSYSLAYGIGQLFYGPLLDHLRRIAVVRAAGVGFSICAILSACSVTIWQFILVRLLAGALADSVIPLTLVFIGDTVEYGLPVDAGRFDRMLMVSGIGLLSVGFATALAPEGRTISEQLSMGKVCTIQ